MTHVAHDTEFFSRSRPHTSQVAPKSAEFWGVKGRTGKGHGVRPPWRGSPRDPVIHPVGCCGLRTLGAWRLVGLKRAEGWILSPEEGMPCFQSQPLSL